jgi:hypothetical protein
MLLAAHEVERLCCGQFHGESDDDECRQADPGEEKGKGDERAVVHVNGIVTAFFLVCTIFPEYFRRRGARPCWWLSYCLLSCNECF